MTEQETNPGTEEHVRHQKASAHHDAQENTSTKINTVRHTAEKNNRSTIWFFKNTAMVILAGILAIIILSGILCFYSFLPVHIENPNRNTDYIWVPHSRWIKMTEGISWGKFDANGFNNKVAISNPDIIVLGSSHMEATNVMQHENTATLLQEKFAGKYTVCNRGISGHHFSKICQYLPANLQLARTPPKIAIIETRTINLSQHNVDTILHNSVEYTPSHASGIIGILQRIPFFRVIYHQIIDGLIGLFMPEKSRSTAIGNETDNNTNGTEETIAYAQLFAYLKELEETYGTAIIIFYHPTGVIGKDGKIEFKKNRALNVFSDAAEQNGITFIDMTAPFEKMFYESHHMAHGFATGKIGTGHLNKYGHAAIAEQLYDAIRKLEEDGKICR